MMEMVAETPNLPIVVKVIITQSKPEMISTSPDIVDDCIFGADCAQSCEYYDHGLDIAG